MDDLPTSDKEPLDDRAAAAASADGGSAAAASSLSYSPWGVFDYVLWFGPRVSILVYMVVLFEWIYQAEGGLSFTEAGEFGYHALAMSLFAVVFMSASSLSMNNNTSLFAYFNFTPKERLLVHIRFHLLSLICIILGLFAIIYYKQWSDATDLFPMFTMYTPHSWLGIITVCLFVLQMLGGVYMKSSYTAHWNDEMKLKARGVHGYIGRVLYISGIVTCMTGFQNMQSSDLSSSTDGTPGTDGMYMNGVWMNATAGMPGMGYTPLSTLAQMACGAVLMLGMVAFFTVTAMTYRRHSK